MTGWGGGYITDIPYTVGWYHHQSPMRMAIAAIIGGARASVPQGDDPVTMLELGCGLGFTAMALAASNPAWTVYGVDFNPAHIAIARRWAAEAGLRNVVFIEADLSKWEEEPAIRDLPGMDFVTLHGVWTWVPPGAQAGIVRLLGRKVLPGGLVHISYNTPTGWADLMAPIHLMRAAGKRGSGRSNAQAKVGLALMADLMEAEAHYTLERPRLSSVLKTFQGAAGSNYLAHEFMNDYWMPCHIDQLSAALSDAKLEFVAASELTDNFPDLMMNEKQREIHDRFDDPILCELVKDMCTPRALRNDIFVRGAQRISVAERNELLMDVSLALTRPASALPEKVGVATGSAELNQAFYGPIVQALSSRPWRIRDLLALPQVIGRRDNPAELIAILSTAEMVEPAARPMTPPGPEAMRFNATNARRMFGRESPFMPVGLACRSTGMPISATLFDLIVMDFWLRGITSVDKLVEAVDVEPENQAKVRESIEGILAEKLPVFKNAGVF